MIDPTKPAPRALTKEQRAYITNVLKTELTKAQKIRREKDAKGKPPAHIRKLLKEKKRLDAVYSKIRHKIDAWQNEKCQERMRLSLEAETMIQQYEGALVFHDASEVLTKLEEYCAEIRRIYGLKK